MMRHAELQRGPVLLGERLGGALYHEDVRRLVDGDEGTHFGLFASGPAGAAPAAASGAACC